MFNSFEDILAYSISGPYIIWRLLSSGYRNSFYGDKAAVAWSWPLTTI